MRIYRCIQSPWISQRFGESIACGQVQSDRSIKVVVKTNNVCPAGYRDLYLDILKMLGHNGTDRPCFYGEPGFFDSEAEFNGKPVEWRMLTEVDSGGGIGVDVISSVPFLRCTETRGTICPPGTFHYVKRRYWHSLRVIGWDNKIVGLGDTIFHGDSTGISGGNHVHESLKWCDKDGNGIHTNNGYYGAFDYNKHPDIEVIDKFVVDEIRERKAAERKAAEIARLEAQIRASQLSLLQLLAKWLFLLQQQIQSIAKGFGGLLKGR